MTKDNFYRKAHKEGAKFAKFEKKSVIISVPPAGGFVSSAFQS